MTGHILRQRRRAWLLALAAPGALTRRGRVIASLGVLLLVLVAH